MTTLRIQWNYLKTRETFRNRPLQTLLRLAVWKLICIFKRPVRVKFNPWALVMILPAELRGRSSIAYANAEDRDKPKSQRYKGYLDETITL